MTEHRQVQRQTSLPCRVSASDDGDELCTNYAICRSVPAQLSDERRMQSCMLFDRGGFWRRISLFQFVTISLLPLVRMTLDCCN